MVDSRLQLPGINPPMVAFPPSRHYSSACVSGQDVAKVAQWDDEQIEYIKEKVTEEGRQQDIKKGKAPAQVQYVA